VGKLIRVWGWFHLSLGYQVQVKSALESTMACRGLRRYVARVRVIDDRKCKAFDAEKERRNG
jgi:hypothetical protein